MSFYRNWVRWVHVHTHEYLAINTKILNNTDSSAETDKLTVQCSMITTQTFT